MPIVELATRTPLSARILALARRHQRILASLDDEQARVIVASWRQARREVRARMIELWRATFALGYRPRPYEVLEFVRSAALVEAYESRLGLLGLTTQIAQTQAFSAGAMLGIAQVNIELVPLVREVGGPAVVGRSSFSAVSAVAHDLGMTAAVAETQNLVPEVRVALQRELVAGALQGEGIRPLVRRLEPLDGIGANRAEMISRWATIKGHNAARVSVLKEAQEVIPGMRAIWLAARSERTCRICLALHGTEWDASGEFSHTAAYGPGKVPPVYGGRLEAPPRHVRCRCTVSYFYEPWRSIPGTLTPENLQEQGRQLAAEAGWL